VEKQGHNEKNDENMIIVVKIAEEEIKFCRNCGGRYYLYIGRTSVVKNKFWS
jgi:hypothetical protein